MCFVQIKILCSKPKSSQQTVRLQSVCHDLPATVGSIGPDVGCVVTMSLYDVDVVLSHSVLTGIVVVTVEVDVLDGSIHENSNHR